MKLLRKFWLLAIRILMGLNSRRRNLYYRFLGVDIRGYCYLRKIEIPRNHHEIRIEPGVALHRGVTLLCSGEPKKEKLVIGKETAMNRNTMIDALHEIRIGANCQFGPACYVTDGNHGMKLGEIRQKQPMECAPVIIEDNVWLGAGVKVLKGVTIGKNSIIGAGSVVNKDVPPNSIYAGVPARFIRELT